MSATPDTAKQAPAVALRAEDAPARDDSPTALRERRYTQIREQLGPSLARVASGYARTAAEREDLIQEIALALWSALLRYRGEASLRTFAFRVARNCAISHLRKRRVTAPAGELACAAPSAERVLERRDRRERLMRAVDELPLGLRHVLTLHFEGLSYAEIGEVVGITEKNVSVRLSRARAALRARLRDTR